MIEGWEEGSHLYSHNANKDTIRKNRNTTSLAIAFKNKYTSPPVVIPPKIQTGMGFRYSPPFEGVVPQSGEVVEAVKCNCPDTSPSYTKLIWH